MPVASKTSERPDIPGGNRAASVGPALARRNTPKGKSRGDRPQTPNAKRGLAVGDSGMPRPKLEPAVKGFPRSRPGPPTSQTARSRGTREAAADAPDVISVGARAADRLEILGPLGKGTLPTAIDLSESLGSCGQTPRGGRRDPYDVPSDSEPSSSPTRGRTSVSTSRNAASSSGKEARVNGVGSSRDHARTLNSASRGRATEPSAPTNASKAVHIAEASPRRPRMPGKARTDIQAILLDSGGEELESRTKPSSSRRIPARIPSDAEIISLTGSSPASDGTEPAQVSTPVRPSAKAMGKRSHHAVDSHLNMVYRIGKGYDAAVAEPGATSAYGNSTPGSRVRPEPDGRASPTPNNERRTPIPKVESDPAGHPSANGVGNLQSRYDQGVVLASKKNEDAERRARRGNPVQIDRGPGPAKIRTTSGTPNSRTSKVKATSAAAGEEAATPRRQSPRAAVQALAKPCPESGLTSPNEKGADQPVADSLSRRPDVSGDGYEPSSNNERKLSVVPYNGRPPPPPQRRTASPSGDVADTSLLSNSGVKLRGGCYPKPAIITPAPTNKLNRENRGKGSATAPSAESKFGRGYSKRVRDAFSDASDSYESQGEAGQDLTRRQAVPERQRIGGDATPLQFAQPCRKPWWNPQAWIDRYETGFVPGEDGRLWLGEGPFVGWISDGPGKGSYMPGFEAPDDETIAGAEKTAILRFHPTWSDSESEQHDNREAGHQDDANGGYLSSDAEGPRNGGQGSHRRASTSEARSREPESFAKGRASEREERMKRTKQYVLSNTPVSPGKDTSSRQAADYPGPIRSGTPRGLSTYPTPATNNLDVDSSPPSAVSEATSTLITRQLVNDCAPPSNQESAGLASSSPAKPRVGSSPSGLDAGERIDSGSDSDASQPSISSSEPSSGIPARLPRKTPSLPATRRESTPVSLEQHPGAVFIANGIAERRTTRPLVERSPSTARSSRRARDAEPADTIASPESRILPRAPPTETNIVVKLPALTAEKRAEYGVTSPIDDVGSSSTALPKTFKEFNEAATESSKVDADDSGEETLNYVLRQSPSWLNSVTELTGFGEARTAESSAKPARKSSSKKPPTVSTMERAIQKPRGKPSDGGSFVTALNGAAAERSPRFPRPQPEVMATSGDEADRRCSVSSKSREKRKGSETGFSTADEAPPPLSKRQKTDVGRDQKKKRKRVQRRRRRGHQKGWQQQQQQQQQQQHNNDNNNDGSVC